MVKFSEVLKDRNFFCLWLGQLISNFGDRLNQMALVALVYQRTPGSEVALAKLISFTIIPVFLIGPMAGVWIDRFNKKNIMIVSDILRGSLVLLIPLFLAMHQILLVYLVIFITFSISRFFIPSKMALIPDIVSKEKLLIANSLNDTTHLAGNVIGLVVAGIIVNISYIGAIGGFYIDAATFFISAILIAMIVQREFVKRVKDDLKITKEALEQSIRRSFLNEIREGLEYLIKHREMRFVAAILFILMAGIGTISCVIIVFIQNAFGTATRDLGFIGMFLVGGLLAGTLIYGRFGQKLGKVLAVLLSFTMTGIFIILFTAFVRTYPNLLIAAVFSALLGISASPIMITTNTLTQEVIPEAMRGRIFSSLEVVIHLAFLIFMFIAAYAANIIDRFWILIGVGTVFSLTGMAGMVALRKRAVT